MLEGSALTGARVGGILVGALAANIALRIALSRFFERAEHGDAERIAALGVIGLAISFGAQPLIRDIIGYVSFVFADNFRAGEDVLMDGKRGELLKFELRGVVLRLTDTESGDRLAYIPYNKIGTVENFDRPIDDA